MGQTNKNFSPFIPASIAFIFGIYAQSYELFNPTILLIILGVFTPIVFVSAMKRTTAFKPLYCAKSRHSRIHPQLDKHGVFWRRRIKNFYSNFTQAFTCIIFFTLGSFALTWQKNQYSTMIQEFDGKKLDLIAKVTNKILLPADKSGDRHGCWKEILEITVWQAKDVTPFCEIKKPNLPARGECFLQAAPFDTPHNARHSGRAAKKNVSNHAGIKFASNCIAPCYKKTNFNLQCYSTSNSCVQVDNIIEIQDVKIKVPQDQSLSQNSSYKNYLIKENLLASVFFYKNKNIKILRTPKFSFKRLIWNIQVNTYQRLQQKMHPTVFTYFSLMFLGNTHHKNIDSMRNTFNYWGLSHYLARSGLHIVLFILIWTIFLQLIPISIRFKRSLLIIICITYKLFSWTSLPFTRAFYAFILTEIGKIFNLQTNFLHLLCIVCMTILLFNPMQLFFLDFQLTFALTFALAFVSKYMH